MDLYEDNNSSSSADFYGFPAEIKNTTKKNGSFQNHLLSFIKMIKLVQFVKGTFQNPLINLKKKSSIIVA